MTRRRFPLLLVLFLPACAYYNGMYNANRLARAAVKAERDGRTLDAASLWGQAGVKADTVIARHGSSKWADDARLLRAKAYERLGDCNSAVTVLTELLGAPADSSVIENGSFLLGQCYQEMGNAEEASRAFSRLVSSKNPEQRAEALYQHGRSLRMGGRFAEALAMIESSGDPRARGERAAALAGVGRVEEAVTLADSLIAIGDTSAPWDSLLALVGRRDPLRGNALTDRAIAMPRATALQRSAWLLGDGERLWVVDQAAAERRITDAISAAGEGNSSGQARLLLLRLRLRRVSSSDSLLAVRADLNAMLQEGGARGIILGRYDRAALLVIEAMDSVARGTSAPDMRLFLAAETARDSLETPRLSAALFRQVADSFSASPYAPKALFALAALDASLADSTHAILGERYPDNPYVLAARGDVSPGFAALEDSLLAFSTAWRRARQATRPRQRETPAPGNNLPEN